MTRRVTLDLYQSGLNFTEMQYGTKLIVRDVRHRAAVCTQNTQHTGEHRVICKHKHTERR